MTSRSHFFFSILLSLRTVVALATFLCMGAVHADATLDRIKQRGKVAIGVMVSGGPFGSIDPATQQLVGWNPDLARDLARQLNAEVELVQVQPSNRVQFLQSGKVDLLIASMEYNADRGELLVQVGAQLMQHRQVEPEVRAQLRHAFRGGRARFGRDHIGGVARDPLH
jgi:polar amino acid transport system substrate-binding protein